MKGTTLKLVLRCSVLACLLVLILGTGQASAAQEFKLGFIEGRGADAAVQEQAFINAEIEYETIGTNDYNLSRLLEFDIIGVGVVAYDQNEDLKKNFAVVNEYVQNGGYLITLDFQQDSTWNRNFLPYPLELFDDDLEEAAGVEIMDHPIWTTPYEITEEHFVDWGAGDFMADGPHEAGGSWDVLLVSGGWPIVIGAEAGKGYVLFSALQLLQALGRTGNEKIAEVLHNFLAWSESLAVQSQGKAAVTWGRLKSY